MRRRVIISVPCNDRPGSDIPKGLGQQKWAKEAAMIAHAFAPKLILRERMRPSVIVATCGHNPQGAITRCPEERQRQTEQCTSDHNELTPNEE